MDAVAGLLDGPRAREAFVLRASMNPPWSLRIADLAPLTLVALARGHAWALPDGDATPCLLETGDVAIFRGPDAYTVADDPTTPINIVELGRAESHFPKTRVNSPKELGKFQRFV